MSDDTNYTSPLSPADREALDALVDAGFQPKAVEGGAGDVGGRAEVIGELFRLLDDYPVEDADDALVAATIARVHRTEEAVIGRIETEAASNRWRMRVPDLISIAAVLLIAVSVTIPIMGSIRQRSIDAGCATNLRTLGAAFSTYANEFDGRAPMAVAGFGPAGNSPVWVDPSRLSSLGYCDHGCASCPGHHRDSGYSRQILRPDRQFSWHTHTGSEPILGDRNPIIDARQTARVIESNANSRGHNGRGQNLLFIDGSSRWLRQPVLGNDDNIWLIRGQTVFEPGLMPETEDDAFLAQ